MSDRVPVVVYWRPGCPYCRSLRSKLRRQGLETTEINIWEDPAGAAEVRSYAHGTETVPTVVIGEVAMINPSATRVLDELRRQDPDAGARLTAPRARWGRRSR